MKERGILFSAEMVRAILAGTKTQTRRIVNVDKLRACARTTFRADLPHSGMVAHDGERLPAQIAKLGAVSVKTSGGWLGAKPGEFDFVCPYADGRTYLDHTPGRDPRWHLDVASGARLWVRETWAQVDARDLGLGASHTVYAATAYDRERALVLRWRPSIHMPRWASRITLDVLSVRVERLHDISEEEARAEGVTLCRDCNGTGYVRVGDFDRDYCCGESIGDATPYRSAFADLWRSINGAESWDANPWVWVVEFSRHD